MLKSLFKLRKSFIKKSISVISSLTIILSVILTVPFVTKAGTEKMFVISPNASGETKCANVFVPLTFTKSGEVQFQSGNAYYFKLSFKANLINGKMPIVGVVRYFAATRGPLADKVLVNNNQESHGDSLLYSTYDEATKTYTALIKLYTVSDPNTGVHTALTIGNMEHHGTTYSENNFDTNFAFTTPKLYAYDTTTGETFGENLLPEISDSTFTGEIYKHPNDRYMGADGLLKAPSNKWSIDTTSSLISIQDIPEGYFDVEIHNFSKVEKLNPTKTEAGHKEHYICDCGKCDGKYYLTANKSSLVPYEQIMLAPLCDQRMFVISPNKSGEKKYANVMIPLDFTEVNGTAIDSDTIDSNYYFKLTFRAKLNNDKTPIVGVVRYSQYNNSETQAEFKYVNNGQPEFADDHKDDPILTSEYDEETLTYTVILKNWVRPHPTTGVHTIITIGNMEHNAGWYKENNWDADFAFATPELYLYDTATGNTVGENLLPDITDANFTNQTYQHGEYTEADPKGFMKAPANKWSIDTTAALISLEEIPEDFFVYSPHKYTHYPKIAATTEKDGRIEYYTCSYEECQGKYFSDRGITEISEDDIVIPALKNPESEPMMIVIKPNAKKGMKYANVFIPLDFREAGGKSLNNGYYYFKLQFKARVESESLPIVGIARYDKWSGGTQSEFHWANNNQDDHGDTVLTSSYNPDTMTFTAIVKMEIKDALCHPETGVHSFITIGNMEHNDAWHKENNFDAEFAFTAPELFAYDPTTQSTYSENLLLGIFDETVVTDKTYKYGKNGYTKDDGFLAAPANKWCFDTTKDLISLEVIPDNYFTPSTHKFEKVWLKAPTKDAVGYKTHYICNCGECDGKYYSDRKGIYETTLEDLEIPKIEGEKIVVIEPKQEGTGRLSNLFIPLNFREVDGVALNGDYYFKLSFKARTFSGGIPIVGVTSYSSDRTSKSNPDYVNNNQAEHSDTVISSSYDANTSTYTAIIKMSIKDSLYHSQSGVHSIITIGNAEHKDDSYEESNLDLSFAFSSPELYLYDASTGAVSEENLINPISDSTIYNSEIFEFVSDSYKSNNGFMYAPANMWSIDGPSYYVNVYDYVEGYFTAGVHNYVEHAYKAPTETESGNELYYTCDCENCKDKYLVNHGLTEAIESKIITKQQMITVSANSGSDTNRYNVFIPLDFRKVDGQVLSNGTYYFKLSFKTKLLSFGMPIVGVARYANWNGGAQTEYHFVNNNIEAHSDEILCSEYDSETGIYTAIIKLYVGEEYSNPETGVHSFITIGNAERNDSWYRENNFGASFSFTSPTMYLYDKDTGSTKGENLLNQLTQNNTDFSKVYKYTKNGYSGADSYVAASANIWSIDGSSSKIKKYDVNKGYFDYSEGSSQILMFAGKNSGTIGAGGTNGKITQMIELEANKKYQLSFNVKYASTGVEGDKIGAQIEYNPVSKDSLVSISAEKTEDADEYKEIYTFTMPEDAKKGKNLKFTFNYSSAFTSGYVANFEVYEVDAEGNLIGENLFKNGDFSENGGAYWGREGSNYRFILRKPVENFFDRVNPVKPNMVIYRNTTDYAQIYQMPMLKPATTYEFKYKDLHTDYASDKKPYTIFYQFYYNDEGKVVNAAMSDDQVTITYDGAYTKKVFTTTEKLRTTGDNNMIFRLYMRSGSAGFWGPVELYELDANGNRIGNNLLLNGDFTCGLDGWLLSGDHTLRTVEFPDNFFEDYKDPEEMIYSDGSAANQAYSADIKVSAETKYYYTGFLVNMNSVGVTPQILYKTKDGTYKEYVVDMFYDADRYYFEIEFETPGDALVTNGLADVRVQINNLNKGKGYFTRLMFAKEGKYRNLLSGFKCEADGNFKTLNYDSGVFVSYLDDKNFDDGDWSGELAENAFEIKYGAINGRVVNINGNDMNSIKMKLVPSNVTAVTNMFGTYDFDELTPGEYKLYLVENENSSLFCMDVTVKKGIISYLPTIIYDNEVTIEEDEEIYEEEIEDSNEDNTEEFEDITEDKKEDLSEDNSEGKEESNDTTEDDSTENEESEENDSEDIIEDLTPDGEEDTSKYGVLRGFYYDRQGNVISGAKIYLRGYDCSITDENGMFNFENVEPGEYDLYTLLEDGSEYILRKVTITANKGIQVKVMEPESKEGSTNIWVIIAIIAGSLFVCAVIVLVAVIIIRKRKLIKK